MGPWVERKKICHQSLFPGLDIYGLANVTVEIAVGTLRNAERPMDVNSKCLIFQYRSRLIFGMLGDDGSWCAFLREASRQMFFGALQA